MKYGRLTVIGRTDHVGGRPALLCQCVCGNKVPVQRKRLISGHTQSCGCLQKQRAAENLAVGHDLNTTHAASRTKEWNSWMGMKNRVRYDNPTSGKHYIEKGIDVAPEWENDFRAFLAHIGPAPSARHSVDRIRGNEGYVPGNVRWATIVEQNRNKSDNVVVSWNGVDRLLVELAQEYAIPYQTLYYRHHKARWPIERALLTPVKHSGATP